MMSSRFGADFGQVRVHTDGHAARSAHDLQAHAYTVGRDIFFAAGRYQPAQREGQRLLAHELTHVLQQQGSLPTALPNGPISQPNDPSEQAADRIAGDIVSSPPVDERRTGAQAAAPRLQASRASRRAYIQRVVNEEKVGCRTTGVPSLGLTGEQAVDAIRDANEAAIRLAIATETRLFVENLLFGIVPTDPTFAAVLREELGLDIANPAHRAHLDVIQRRFELARTRILESDFTGYTCIGAANVALGTGTPAACAGPCCAGGAEACACTGVSHIVLCRPWWAPGAAPLRGATLIHEALHIYFGFIVDHVNPKLTDAHCYEAFAARLAGLAPFHSCAGR